jgi:hypothetical protein
MPKSVIWLISLVGVVVAIAFGVIVHQALLGDDSAAPQESVEPEAAVTTPEAPTVVAPRPGPQSQTPTPPVDEELTAEDVFPPEDPVESVARNGLPQYTSSQPDVYKYRLPASLMAKSLAGARDPKLRFTPEQLKVVAAVEAEMKKEIVDNLKPIWDTRALLRIQMEAFRKNGNTQGLRNAQGQHNQELEKELAFRAVLNQEYAKRLEGVLNSEQMRYFTGGLTPEMQARLYGSPLEETDPSAGSAANTTGTQTVGRDSRTP